MIERQELHCHNCDMFVQFDIDTELDGNHVLECPNCGHEHCRVVKNGVITDRRWDQRNGLSQLYGGSTNTYVIANATCTANATYDTCTSGTCYGAWMNTQTGSTG